MLTVFIATRDGARTLPRTLEAFAKLEAPDGGWKLVVIDNSSVDATPDILSAFSRKLPLTLLTEKKPGKNAALNTGLAHLDGDLAVFSDDDVLPSQGWLRGLRAAADARKDFSIFGGPIFPEWETPPPAWLLGCVPIGSAYSLIDRPADGPMHGNLLYGPNLAMRADIFAKGFRYNEAIGPRGKSYAMGSETDLLRRLFAAGHTAWFSKEASVRHIIRSYQIDPAWLFGRARRAGRGDYRLVDVALPAKTVWGIPRYLFRLVFETGCRAALNQVAGNPAKAFVWRWKMNYLLGKAIEARLMNKEDQARKEDR